MDTDQVSLIKEPGHRDQADFNHTAGRIEEIFENNKESLGRVFDLSHKIKEGIRVIDQFIEQNTSVVCPKCRHICCTSRHAYYNCDDLIYIYALGLRPQEYVHSDALEPCPFLSRGGCKLERTIRPSVCNWYFCDALYDRMDRRPGKAYNDFNDSFQELIDLWKELTHEFLGKFKEIKGYEMRIADLVHSSHRRVNNPYRI